MTRRETSPSRPELVPLDPLRCPLTGVNLVEASAGTGKTYTIATLFLRLVLERGLRVEQILVVTFTEAATAELRDRIRARLREALEALDARPQEGRPDASATPPGDELLAAVLHTAAPPDDREAVDRARLRLTSALSDFDEASISTIHGWCRRALLDNAFEGGLPFDTELVADVRTLHEDAARDFWVARLHDADPLFVEHLRQGGDGPEALRPLVDRALADPEQPILPAPTDRAAAPGQSSGSAEASERFAAAWNEAQAAWRVGRDEIGTTLLQSPGLNRARYRAATVAGWPTALDTLFGGGPTPGLAKRAPFLERLTPAKLQAGTKKGHQPPEHPFFEAAEALWAAAEALSAELESARLQLLQELVVWVRREIPRRKADAQVQSFDDLLLGLHAALRSPGGPALAQSLLAQRPAALIDEFQDTDPVQYAIFQAVYAGAAAKREPASGGQAPTLFLIGDPKQAIYAFRGADVFTYLTAADDAERRFTLETNWRSDSALVRGVNHLFGSVPQPFLLDRIDFLPVGAHHGDDRFDGGRFDAGDEAAVCLRTLRVGPKPIAKDRATARITRALVVDITRLLTAGATVSGRALQAADIAVLTRTNREADRVQVALRQVGVPSVVRSAASVFVTDEAAELERVLRALVSPNDAAAVRAALATSLFGLDAPALAALQDGDRAWESRLETFRRWHELWAERGFVRMARALLDDEGVRARLLSGVGGERALVNILHLVELLHGAAAELGLGMDGMLRWLRERRAGAADVGDEAQLRLESDARAVQIVTVHKSKGLEYPVVFCPFLWDGAALRGADKTFVPFHDPADGWRAKLDIGSTAQEAHGELALHEVQAESLRLLYVALTRARHRVVVYWGRFKGAESSALAHILHGATAPLDQLDDDSVEARLRTLSAASAGAVRTSTVDEEAPLVPPPRTDEASGALTARRARRPLDGRRRTSSFSGLISAGRAAAIAGGDVPPDAPYDPGDEPDPDTVDGVVAPDEGPPVRLADFPSGTEAGLCLHWIFEHIDFEKGDDATIAKGLARYGYDGERWLPVVREAYREILTTPLDAAGTLRLRDVPRARRLDELGFVFPVRPGRAALTPAQLAAPFRRHGNEALAAYGERLARLRFLPLEGFLRGFVDLVFEHGGVFHVVDYKSNILGKTTEPFRADRLPQAMEHGDYYLQYHLYVVALHRYLKLRLAGYDYDRHMGESYYLFIRGMTPDRGPGYGVFRDRPPRALIQELDAVLADAAAAGGSR